MSSLLSAEKIPVKKLNADGNRAVMLCTTTDPYQTIIVDRKGVERKTAQWHDARELRRTPLHLAIAGLSLQDHLGMSNQEYTDWCLHQKTAGYQKRLNEQLETNVRRALGILASSTLNVRILTRSPLARRDFDLMKLFGTRLLFGMSLPTLNNKLAKIYEPKAPAPTQRLETLRRAKEAGLHIYVAVAPVYPECDAADLESTLRAVQALDPVTIFMEPINIRADNVARIEQHAKELGETLKTDVFATPASWREYALEQLLMFESVARETGITDKVLHLWPDKSLGSQESRRHFSQCNWAHAHYTPVKLSYDEWLQLHWNKISQWPK